MKKILLLFFCGVQLSLPAQISDSSTTYIHAVAPSSNAKAVQGIFAFLGIKHRLLNYMTGKRHIPQRAATLPLSLRSKFHITTAQIAGHRVWTITPKSKISETTILYLHGGAYILNISSFHWKFIEKLLSQTQATIVIPDYPLAPAAHAENVYACILAVYREIFSRKPRKLVVMGDSAGGGLALGFSEYLQTLQMKQPDEVVLLSPWLDVTMSNADATAVNHTDKMLNIRGLQLAGKAYAGAWNETDYRISPLFGQLSGLPPISIFTGTHDVLMPDSRKLKALLQQQHSVCHYYEYPQMFHGWMVVTGLRESKTVMKQLATIVNH
ncbi:MAG: alpha/beta hydrolase [Chitinophagales bacterium]